MGLQALTKKIMQVKIYISRTLAYLSLMNSGMILILLLGDLTDRGVINIDIGKYFLVIYATTIIGLIVVGWIEVEYLEGNRHENLIAFEYNPQLVEMKKKIDEIDNYLKNKDKNDTRNSN